MEHEIEKLMKPLLKKYNIKYQHHPRRFGMNIVYFGRVFYVDYSTRVDGMYTFPEQIEKLINDVNCGFIDINKYTEWKH